MAEVVTEYMPGSRLEKVKLPAPVDVVVVVMPVASLVAAITAPGITAPVLSATVPVMAPFPESCAIAVPAHIRMNTAVKHASHDALASILRAVPRAVLRSQRKIILLISICLLEFSSKNCPAAEYTRPHWAYWQAAFVVRPLSAPYHSPIPELAVSIECLSIGKFRYYCNREIPILKKCA